MFVCLFVFSNSDPRQWAVTFGISTRSPIQRRGIRNIIIHNDYKPATHENDIALVQLDRPVTFTKNIRRVCLPEATQNILPGSTAYITGWGSQSYGGKCFRKNKTKITTKSLVVAII